MQKVYSINYTSCDYKFVSPTTRSVPNILLMLSSKKVVYTPKGKNTLTAS